MSSLIEKLRSNKGAVLPVLPPMPVSKDVELSTFYGDVLPPVGQFALWTKTNKQNTWYSSLEDLTTATEQLGTAQGIYFATAAFNEQAAINGNKDARTQANVASLKAFRLDLDAGEKKVAKHGEDKVYATQSDALRDTIRLAKAAKLPPSYIISSGEGLHLYWVLQDAISASAWTPVAKRLSRLAEQLGVKQDFAVTTDSARVLRPLGTVHENGNEVVALQASRKVYTLEDFEARITNVLVASEDDFFADAPKRERMGINKDQMDGDDRKSDLGAVVANCGALAAVVKAKGNVEEPYWRAMLGLVKHTVDGDKAAHAISSGYADYDHSETQKKLDKWTAGPTTCAEFAKYSTACNTCDHRGKHKSPISLGILPPDQPLKQNPDSIQALEAVMRDARLQFVLDTDGQLSLTTESTVDGRRVCSCLYADSEAANDAIVSAASASGKTPSDRAIEAFKAKSRHAARERGEAVRVFLRVAEIDNVIYVDLAPGQIVRIDSLGCTMVDDLADGVPLFRRGTGVGHLPSPQFPSGTKAALRFAVTLFVEQFGLAKDQALVTIATLLEWHRTKTPHPILESVGVAGSGKSSFADFLRWLLDPSMDGSRMTIGTNSKDIAAAAQQRHVLQIDNAGKIDKSLSDMLCIVSTGGTLTVRKLYSEGATVELNLHRALIVTAVYPVCTPPDLQNRVNRIELSPRFDGFVAENVLRARLDALRPQMLGALYTLLSGALRVLPDVRLSGKWEHRLVDFDQMGEAMVQSAGLRPGTFLTAIGPLRERMARRTASGDLFLIAMLKLLRAKVEKPTHERQPTLNAVLASKEKLAVVSYGSGRFEVTARPGALHKLLPNVLAGYGQHNAMPATERGLTDAIRRVQPLLSSIGIQVQELTSGTRTLIRFAFDQEALSDV